MTAEELRTTARDLHAAADWIERHSETIATVRPAWMSPAALYVHCKSREEMARLARHLGRATKEVGDDYLNLRRAFGTAARIEVYAAREVVCKRVVIGTREVAEQVIPAQAEKVVPAHTEEVVEWLCPPLLRAVLKDEDAYDAAQDEPTVPTLRSRGGAMPTTASS